MGQINPGPSRRVGPKHPGFGLLGCKGYGHCLGTAAIKGLANEIITELARARVGLV